MTLAMAPLDVEVEVGVDRLFTALSGGSTVELPCRVYDADLWFAETPAELETAKALCAQCPLRVECLAGALERGEPWGVWGGEIFERGAVVPRKRPRGRPRKEDVARDAVLRVELAARAAALVSGTAA
jgi:WhiB family redox-sensing transcriptional regulator